MKATITAALGAVLMLATLAPAQAADDTLYLFNWADYISPDLIKEFEQTHHVKVVQNFYGGNSELQAKLQAGADSQYDVIVPSSYFIKKLVNLGLIQKLDHSQLPNLKNLYSRFQDPEYDPNDTYSVPYQWGTTGIAYNTEHIKNAPESWSLLFDPKQNENYPFALLLGDGEVIMGGACAYLGLDYTCQSKDKWVQAAQLIIKTKNRKNMTGFVDGDPALTQLEHGVVDVAVTFNGNVASDASENPEMFKHIKYFLPKEGTELWVDTMAIPTHAPHPKLAHEFINFLLDAHKGAELSNYNYYASPNEAAKPYLDDILQTPLITPTAEQMKHLYFTPTLTGETLKTFNQIWSEVRSQ